jgi:hemerythrin-like domain-containing protein
MQPERREFLLAAGAFAVATLGSTGTPRRSEGKEMKDRDEPEIEISAPEDLMREHGVLDRILLIYEEGVRRLQAGTDLPPAVVQQSATLVRQFVEEYHEHLEEAFIFPRFEQAKTLLDVVAVLRQQHQAGRVLTDAILAHATAERLRSEAARQTLARSCEVFVRMYRPHAAREDTVLFPALYTVMGAAQVKDLGEQFEKEEHRRFGEHGFDRAVEQVAAIEKQLGIYDLAAFTPK